MVLGRGAEEISVPPIPDTFLDTIVDGDADDSHEKKETNNYARHATSTKKTDLALNNKRLVNISHAYDYILFI